MKLIWHIIRKDVSRDRWALLLWALLFVGQDMIGVFARTSVGFTFNAVKYLQMASLGLVFLQFTMGYVLVARWVQADPLIGTRMFWRTRPISAARLFAAKLLGVLLLFALLPVLLLLPWWLYCQFGWREILWTAVDNIGWQLLLIAPAFLVASLTDDLGRVLLWTLLLVIGLLSWIVLLSSSLGGSLGRLLSDRPASANMFTRLWVCSLVMVGGSLAIAAHQYLTRRFVRSVVVAVFGLGLIALTGQVWPWNWGRAFASLHKPTPAPVPGLVERLTFAVEPTKGNFGGGFKARNVDERDAWLWLRLRVRGLPEDLGIATEAVSQTWTWDKGMQLTRSTSFFYSGNYSFCTAVLRRTYSLPVPVDEPETAEWRKLSPRRRAELITANRAARGAPPVPLWYADLEASGAEGTLLTGKTTLPNSYLAKMQAEPPAYRANTHWILYRPEVVAELPLKDDVRASGRGMTLHLQRMYGANPLVLQTRPSVTLYGVWFARAGVQQFGSLFWSERFMAVNRVTGDVHEVPDSLGNLNFLQVGGVLVTWNVLLVSPRVAIRNGRDVPADPQWLDHTFLVLQADTGVAAMDHAVEMAKFEVKLEGADQNP